MEISIHSGINFIFPQQAANCKRSEWVSAGMIKEVSEKSDFL